MRAALDFLLPARSSCGNQPQQDLAIASCLAQAEALIARTIGRDGARRAGARRACLRHGSRPLLPHKVHPGSRPSTIVLFQRLDPATLGPADRAV